MGHGQDGIAARAADRRLPEHGGELVLGTQADASLQPIHARNVLVERRLAHLELLRQRRESQARQAHLVGDAFGLFDDAGLGGRRIIKK
jgi:hypothetical protein